MALNWSVVLIGRNEEKTLPRLLASLEEFKARGGIVVLVDTGSTDKTAQLAKDWGCVVEEVGDRFRVFLTDEQVKAINDKFIVEGEVPVVNSGDSLFDYSSARNYAASLSPTDMVAMPDCDEAYTTLNIDNIQKVIEDGAEQLEYNFVFAHDAEGRPAVKFRHCKFYDRRKLHWQGIIHEVLQGSAQRQFLDEDVVYLEHWQNHETNRGHYLKGLALDCFEHPDNDRNSHYFARELSWTGRPKSAIKEFERHLAMERWPAERGSSLIFMGNCYLQLGQDDKALECYFKSFLMESGRRESLIRLAEYFWRKQDPQKVASFTAAALEIPESGFYANDMSHYRHYPHELMYWAKWYLGDKEGSKEHYDKAVAYFPTNPKYLHDRQFYYSDAPKTDLLDVLTTKLEKQEPFIFVKRGDGEEACMRGDEGGNCDGHPYTPDLGERLTEAFDYLRGKAFIVQFDNQKEYNSLLHRTDSDLTRVKQFWETVKKDTRRKIFVGPNKLRVAANYLKALHVGIPEQNVWETYRITNPFLEIVQDGDIVIFCASMPAKVMIADLIKERKNLTCIDAGSAFDPFIKQSRTYQITPEEMQRLYV